MNPQASQKTSLLLWRELDTPPETRQRRLWTTRRRLELLV
jgi:hypothetical protein